MHKSLKISLTRSISFQNKNFSTKICVIELKPQIIYLQDDKPRCERHLLTIVVIIAVLCFWVNNNVYWREQLEIEQEKTKGFQVQYQKVLEQQEIKGLHQQIALEQETSRDLQARIEMLQEQMEHRELQFKLRMTQEQEKSRGVQAQLEIIKEQVAIWQNKYESAEEMLRTCQIELLEFQKKFDLNIFIKKGACVLGTLFAKPGLQLFC